MKIVSAVFCSINRRNIRIKWKIVAGTKLDILRQLDTIKAMAEAGCRYLSMSPESGSSRVLKLMKKPFNHDRGVELARMAHRHDVRLQACFVVGFPGEDDDDRQMTRRYVRKLAKAGVDEIAVVCTPVRGLSSMNETGYDNLSELSFSPEWRKEYRSGTLNGISSVSLWKLTSSMKMMRQPTGIS